MKIHSFALILVGLVILSSVSYAYTIEGNSVFIEDAQASLKVTPATAQHPSSEGYEQEFEICNKTGTTTNLFGAYVFNNELENGKAEYLISEDYEWVEYEKQCYFEFEYYTNVNPAPNIHQGNCYYFNSKDEKIITFDIAFKTGNVETGTIQYDVNELVKTWSNVTTSFEKKQIANKFAYTYTEGKTVLANSCETWRITYKPNENDTTKKWDLWLWVGEEWSCILTDTCLKTLKLDPWWDSLGSEADPYIMTDCNSLNWALDHNTNNTEVYFELGNDIDCSGYGNWEPIGNGTDVTFQGQLDGNNFSISNVTINSTVNYNAGLISVIGTSGVVKNLALIDFNVWTPDYGASALAGICTAGLVENVYVQGAKVSGGDGYIGGFIGLAYTGCIIRNNYIVDSTVTANAGITIVGGFVGRISSDANIFNSYSNTEVRGGAVNVGAFLGEDAGGSCTNCFYDTDTAIETDTACGTGKTTANMFKQLTFTNWDFDTIWKIEEDINYPLLQSFFPIPPPAIIDLNITTINGLSFLTHPIFAYGLDGNITIDFDVFQEDNNRLSIDINYSQTSNQGTGTVIVKDLNLVSTICADQDWSDVPSTCSYSWNYSEIADGNYGIIGLLTDSFGSTDFNNSDANFEIANDVNLVVLAPINENTGLLIPSRVVGSTIGYSVKITTEDTIKFYDNMIDENSFTITYQTTPILITIDVNVADEYYSRQYSINFNEATSTYTIQPYLAPVADSGNFIFYVTNLTTTGPLADVTIIIDGIVPGADGVVIQEIVTDSAGTATIPLLLDTEYTATFYYDGVLVHTATLVPTASSLTYQVGLDISAAMPPPPPIGSIQVKWSPETIFLLQNSDGSIDINAQIWLHNKTVSTIQAKVYDSNGCLYENSFFGALWTDGNTIDFQTDLNTGLAVNIYTGTPCIFDNNTNIHSIFVTIDINSTDGNRYFARSISWQIVQLDNYQWNLWYRLGITADALNPPGTKIISSIVSFFIVFIAVFAASKTVGNAFFTAMVGLVLLGFCVYFGWFEATIFYFIVFGTLVYSLYAWGKTG